MAVVYGTDYSARELSPSELDQLAQYDIRFLIRYIGWPDNPADGGWVQQIQQATGRPQTGNVSPAYWALLLS
jgi:hypothetical protein